jgi:hypothetical protein
MKLSVGQVDLIQSKVERSGIRIKLLKDDVLDHLCCVVEMELDKGKSFEVALKEAIKELAPNGLGQIEKETVYLLNSKKILRMKKIMYSIGFIGSVALTGGFLFKILHWAGGDELFMGGFLVLSLLFAPLLAIDKYKVSVSQAISEKLRIILGSLSAVTIGTGLLLKVLGVFGGDFLFLGGSLLFAAGFLPFLFFSMYKRSIG